MEGILLWHISLSNDQSIWKCNEEDENIHHDYTTLFLKLNFKIQTSVQAPKQNKGQNMN